MRYRLHPGFFLLAAVALGCGPAVPTGEAQGEGSTTSEDADGSGDSTGGMKAPTSSGRPPATTVGSAGDTSGGPEDDGSSSGGPIQVCPEDEFPSGGEEVLELVAQSSVDEWGTVGDGSVYFSFLTEDSAIDGESARGISASDDADGLGFGGTVSTLSAEAFRGQRVRMWSWVAREEVVHRANLWLRVDGPGGPSGMLALDNGDDHPGHGTSTDWEREEVVLDVPETATTLAFGSLLTGPGLFVVNDPTFEIVSDEVPTTHPNRRRPAGAHSCLSPTDENTETILHVFRPDSWGPFGPETPTPSIDTDNTYNGVRTLRLDASPGGTWGGFTTSTTQLATERIRVTIPMRAEGFAGTARLAITMGQDAASFGHAATVNPTEAWSSVSVVTEVPTMPDEGSAISLEIDGMGTVWLGYGQIERVGPEVPLSDPV